MAREPLPLPYIPNTEADRQAMLATIGVGAVEELFADIPSVHRRPALHLPSPLSEMELLAELGQMAGQNANLGEFACFRGGGAYHHFIPAVVRHITSRNEFYTAYTPYQPEVSQGTLQSIYEFQSLVCQLTGMEVANAGMYDGATALAEAALMSARVTGRGRVAVLEGVAPHYRDVVRTYLSGPEIDMEVWSGPPTSATPELAAILVQQPNFYGYQEDLSRWACLARESGALLVVAVDPISLGLFRPPADFDADIVVAEGQSLGVSLSFGGPYVGLFACKERYLRQMPGRIVGRTTDLEGREGYVLTLQPREQHIRRERATSNICTNQALVSLAVTAYLGALGRQGLRRVAELCYHKAHYAATQIANLPGYSLQEGAFFKEFVVRCPRPPAQVNHILREWHIVGGLDVSDQIPNGMLLCVTEMNTRAEIDRLVAALAGVGA